MIVFKGEHSKECTKYIRKLHHKVKIFEAIYVIFFAEVLVCIIGISWRPQYWLHILLYVFLGYGFLNYLLLRPPPKSEYGKIMTTSVSILDDGTIVSKGQKFKYEIGVENVTKVVDHGSFYELYLNKVQNRGFYICEKALLKSGTIDDFEKIFKGKIVRKEEKKK